MNLYIGTSGYFYWEWKGVFYPVELKPSQWFEYYSKYFNTLEINSTFYRFPSRSSIKNWYKIAPDGFLYSVKVNKLITHIKKFKGTKEILNGFYSVVSENLREKLGAFLFQLPPSFRYSVKNFGLILNQLNPDFINVIEFRNKTWFRDEVYDALKENNAVFCCVSAPKFEVCSKTSDTMYVRFHGKKQWYRYKYSDEELKEWVDRIHSLSPETVFIYFNNTYKAYAVENAIRMKQILNQIKT